MRSDPTLGKFPTENVQVQWFLVGHPEVKGTTSTNADGYYSVTILVRLARHSHNSDLLSKEFLTSP